MSIDVPAIHRAAASLGPRAFVALLGREPAPRGRPDQAVVRCFVHADDNPSCTVIARDGKLLWRCHACNVGGDAITACAAVWGIDPRGKSFPELARRVADLLGVRVEDGRPAAPPKRRDPAIALAAHLDAAADRVLAGQPLYPAQEAAISQATPAQLARAMRVLDHVDARRIAALPQPPPDDQVDAELDRLADAHEAAQRPTTSTHEAA